MSYGDFYFYPYRKKTLILSFTKKRPNPNVSTSFYIFSRIKKIHYSATLSAGFSIPSLVARSSIRLILKSRSGCVENSWFSLLETVRRSVPAGFSISGMKRHSPRILSCFFQKLISVIICRVFLLLRIPGIHQRFCQVAQL